MKELTLLELKDKRGIFVEENERLSAKIQVEKRALTPEEDVVFKENEKNAAELEILIQEKEDQRKMPEKRDMKVKTEKRFSLLKSIRDIANGGQIDSEFAGLMKEGRDEFSHAQVPDGTRGQIILPSQTKSDLIEQRATIVSTNGAPTTTGGYAIAMDWKTVLPPLTNYLVLTKAGATFLTGLVGNVQIPTYSGTSVAWATEVAAATDGAGTWGVINLYPKRLTAFVDVSKQFLMQDQVGAETMLMANIAKAVSAKLESTILGGGVGSATTQPAGLFYSIVGSATNATATWAGVVALESTVNTANALFGNLGYITSPAGLGTLKTTQKATYANEMICEDMTVNGYPIYVTSGCAKGNQFTATTTGNGLIFGNWADLIIGQWGGFDILVDPYTQAAKATVRLVVNCFFDAAAERAVGVGFSTMRLHA